MGRIVVEHKDGRRVGTEEEDFDNPAANPFNNASMVVEANTDGKPDRTYMRPARPVGEHQSLKAEGFKPVMRINKDGHEASLKGD